MRIKKIAERRTIWGGGRLRRKRGAEDHGDGREQPQERGARRLDRLHLPGGAGAQQRRPGLGHGRHRDMTNLERRLIDDDDGAAPASHYLPSLLIATYAGATTVAPPGRAARERGRPALCANVLDEFVRALLPRLDLTSGGPARGLHAPPGPNGLLQGRHVPPALLPPHRSSYYPACRSSLPSAHKEFAIESDHVFQFAVFRE